MHRQTSHLHLQEVQGSHAERLRSAYNAVWKERVRHPHPHLHRTVLGTRHSTFLCLPDLLRRPLVSRRVLVLQSLHTLYAYCI